MAEGMPFLGTFHCHCGADAAQARMRGSSSWSQNFTILDTDDQLRLLKQVVIESGHGRKALACENSSAGMIDRWKNRG